MAGNLLYVSKQGNYNEINMALNDKLTNFESIGMFLYVLYIVFISS